MYRYALLSVLVVLVFALNVHAQDNQFLTRADSDPQALSLLEKLKQQLNQERLAVEFEMTISYPAEKPIVQKGKLIQQKEQFRITSTDYEIWSNGESRWIYQRKENEVNLYSAGDGDEMSPLNLIEEYTGDQYVAVINATDQIRGFAVQVIELKPIDRASEVAKIRLSLQENGKPVRFEIFEKSAARTVTDIMKISVPENQTAAYFTFNKAEYPGVHVEDLRID